MQILASKIFTLLFTTKVVQFNAHLLGGNFKKVTFDNHLAIQLNLTEDLAQLDWILKRRTLEIIILCALFLIMFKIYLTPL